MGWQRGSDRGSETTEHLMPVACLDCGVVVARPRKGRCASCYQRSQRKYGHAHQQQRRRWAVVVATGVIRCSRCGERARPGVGPRPSPLGQRTIARRAQPRSEGKAVTGRVLDEKSSAIEPVALLLGTEPRAPQAGNTTKRALTTSPGPWKRWRTRTRAARCIRFAESYCVVPKGYNAGRTMRLAPFQKSWLEVFADDVTSAALLVPRGNGKSSLLAAMALWGLFDDDEHGSPQVPAVAVTVGQAIRNVFGVAVAMRARCEPLAERSIPYSGTGTSRLVTPFNGGEMFPITSDPDGLQGLDPSVAV